MKKNTLIGIVTLLLTLIGFGAQPVSAILTSSQVNTIVDLARVFGVNDNTLESVHGILSGVAVSSPVQGHQLTSTQINAITGLLQSFGAEKEIIDIMILIFGGTIVPPPASIKVIAPNGGEEIPQNAYLVGYAWSNSGPLRATAYLDRYNDSGVLLETFLLATFTSYNEGRNATFWSPAEQGTFPLGKYKFRATGVTETGEYYTDESDGFFTITPPVKMAVQILGDESYWFPNQTKKIELSWTDLQVGDPYAVYLYPNFYVEKEDHYGFMLKSGTIEARDGTLVFDATFPTSDRTDDGEYGAIFVNLKNRVQTSSRPINLILNEVHITALPPAESFTAKVKKEVKALDIEIDARFAQTDIRSITLPLLVYFHPLTSHAKIRYALYEKDERISKEEVITITGEYKYQPVTLSAHHDFEIKRGRTKVVTLHIEVISDTGGFIHWALDNGTDSVRVTGKKNQELSGISRFGVGPVIDIVPAKDKH